MAAGTLDQIAHAVSWRGDYAWRSSHAASLCECSVWTTLPLARAAHANAAQRARDCSLSGCRDMSASSKSVTQSSASPYRAFVVALSEAAKHTSAINSSTGTSRLCSGYSCSIVQILYGYPSTCCHPSAVRATYDRIFTAREATRATVSRDMSDCTNISILAHGVRGKQSVGLNAVAFVNER